MTEELAVVDQLALILTESVQSENTRRSYLKSLNAYREFARDNGIDTIDRDTLTKWRNSMTAAGSSASTVNVRLSGMKCLIRELQARDAIEAAEPLLRVKGVRAAGVRSGRWMDKDQALRLLNSPEDSTTIGIRDRALIAFMLSTGVRRFELASLDMSQLKVQNGIRCVINVLGKGNKLRSLAIPPLADKRLQDWIDRANISEGKVFRSVDQFGNIGKSLSPDGIRSVIERRAKECGMELACHDIRRSCAYLARKDGAPLEAIQAMFGHQSIVTTTAYLQKIFQPEESASGFIQMFKEIENA